MKLFRKQNLGLMMLLAMLATSCKTEKEASMGTYEYDAQFLKNHEIEYIELSSDNGLSRVMVIPLWQGRVMTSTSMGEKGDSYGWVNYKFIEKQEINSQFNPVGGEERFWLGPEGGPYSLYFAENEEQVYKNWNVPSVLDTEGFDVRSKTKKQVDFAKITHLVNAHGTQFDVEIHRSVRLIEAEEAEEVLNIKNLNSLKVVGYESVNSIKNIGTERWSKDKGLMNIWMLGCFNPSPTTTVFIPYHEKAEGVIVNDEYFGKVPADRLIAKDSIVYFKIDGKFRSKIGLPAARAKGICGSYDSSRNLLTILTYSMPEKESVYLNGQWGAQDNPFEGDVINSYNDGPVDDGSIMGPFYEIETSSPGVELESGETLKHRQATFHIQGEPEQLAEIVKQLFGADLKVIASIFKH